jgi:hypothetical protein
VFTCNNTSAKLSNPSIVLLNIILSINIIIITIIVIIRIIVIIITHDTFCVYVFVFFMLVSSQTATATSFLHTSLLEPSTNSINNIIPTYCLVGTKHVPPACRQFLQPQWRAPVIDSGVSLS